MLSGRSSRKIEGLKKALRELELRQMLSDENDNAGAIVSINAGAGGTEAQDWTEMLLRMYLRWCEKRNFTVQMVDMQEGEEAGIKSATFTVAGANAYGLLKAESGIHRLVRISPFDASGRRHTSFAAVFVYPEMDETIEVDIKTVGPARRHLSGQRGGRAACEQDAAPPSASRTCPRDCRCVSEREIAASQSGYRHEDPARPACTNEKSGSSRKSSRRSTTTWTISPGEIKSAPTSCSPIAWSRTTERGRKGKCGRRDGRRPG